MAISLEVTAGYPPRLVAVDRSRAWLTSIDPALGEDLVRLVMGSGTSPAPFETSGTSGRAGTSQPLGTSEVIPIGLARDGRLHRLTVHVCYCYLDCDSGTDAYGCVECTYCCRKSRQANESGLFVGG